MARLARIVVPGVAHHVTQWGNRGLEVFFAEPDYAAYHALLAQALDRNGIRCLAWCLMPDRVHLVLVPPAADALRAALAEAQRRYVRRINAAREWSGFLFHGRFGSYPLDEAWLTEAISYVELGPVRAGLTVRAEDWLWSSAKARGSGTPDGLTDLEALAQILRERDGPQGEGAEAGAPSPEATNAIETHIRTGRPLGDAAFIARLEGLTGRTLGRQKPGPKPRASATGAAPDDIANAGANGTPARPALRPAGPESPD